MAKKQLTASEMGKKRWKNIPKKEHSEIARKAVNKRWENYHKQKELSPDDSE